MDRKPLGTSTIGPHPARSAPAVAPRDPPCSAVACRSAIGRPILPRIGRWLAWGRGGRRLSPGRRSSRAGVAEWQTRWTQNPLPARACGFKSHLRHSSFRPPRDGLPHVRVRRFRRLGRCRQRSHLRLVCDGVETRLWTLGIADSAASSCRWRPREAATPAMAATRMTGPMLFLPLTHAARACRQRRAARRRLAVRDPPRRRFSHSVCGSRAHAWCSIALPAEMALPDSVSATASGRVTSPGGGVRRLRQLVEEIVAGVMPLDAASPAHEAAGAALVSAATACWPDVAPAASAVGRPRLDRAEIIRRAMAATRRGGRDPAVGEGLARRVGCHRPDAAPSLPGDLRHVAEVVPHPAASCTPSAAGCSARGRPTRRWPTCSCSTASGSLAASPPATAGSSANCRPRCARRPDRAQPSARPQRPAAGAVTASITRSRLKLPGFCRGGNSRKLCSHWPT